MPQVKDSGHRLQVMGITCCALVLASCSGESGFGSNDIDPTHVRFINDGARKVTLELCTPPGWGDSRIGDGCDRDYGTLEASPGDYAEEYVDVSSVWRVKGTKDCVLVVANGESRRDVPLSRAKACATLDREFRDGLCPDSSYDDGWWAWPTGDDAQRCRRERQRQGVTTQD